jgi:hypothetical protein
MAMVFRGRFVTGLRSLRRDHGAFAWLTNEQFSAVLDKVHEKPWNVYAKAPLAGTEAVYRYLGQYTHRVGISNHRLLAWDGERVTFRTRGAESVTLGNAAFSRRFLNHVLPHGFVKIRHYGLMANGGAVQRRERARDLLAADAPARTKPDVAESEWRELLRELTGVDLYVCRKCGKRAVVREPLPVTPTIVTRRSRAPPDAERAA